MKKLLCVMLGGTIVASVFAGNAAAQSADKGIAFEGIKNKAALAAYVKENNEAKKEDASTGNENIPSSKMDIKESKARLKALRANFRATESFRKMFNDVKDADWKVGEEAIVATFRKDDVKTSSVYDKTGHFVHSLSYFPAEKTPNNIRSVVEANYPNADITLAVQVKENGLEFYIVQLEDKKTYKQIGVYEGETNLIKEFNKIR